MTTYLFDIGLCIVILILGNNFDPHPGGDRTVTLLGYCSDDLIGGYTIFPGLGLRIIPQKGDALFWVTIKNDQGLYHSSEIRGLCLMK